MKARESSNPSNGMNTNVTIARGRCPKCGKEDVPMRNNFTLHEHRNADTVAYPERRTCLGPGTEVMLTILLRSAGLDVRPDRESPELWDEPDWVRKQIARDERDQTRYGEAVDK